MTSPSAPPTETLKALPAPLREDEAFREQLERVFATSEFVARTCQRNPNLLPALYASGDLRRCRDAADYRRSLPEAADEAALIANLRRTRQREMVRIAWRDLAGLATLEEILAELSDLADTLIDYALANLYRWHCERFGTPRDAQGKAQRLVVLGMGKLGGRELNFSSDIDLIFAYPERGETDARRPRDNENFFRRLGQRLINALAEHTAEGFVYRVDMRLRPFGDAGPLAMSFDAFEDYYQTHGREWERYAMIKARVVAGDKTSGAQLLDALRPFVYRRYLDYGAFESLRAMKALIAKEIERKGLQNNIKLGAGGIREIEFIGQAFQLIYGGWESELRARSIQRVLDHLAASERLEADIVAGLQRAYRFLRRTENRLQAWADQQTHHLPGDAAARARLAYAMDFADWQGFIAELDRHRARVTGQFRLLFAEKSGDESAWDGDGDDSEKLSALGFDDPAAAGRSLERLRASFNYRALGAQGRERLERLWPLLLGDIAEAAQPSQTLARITKLLEAILRRSVYLALLVESPVARAQLVKLCAASSWIADYLTRYPVLLDDLINPATLYQPRDRNRLAQDLDRDLGSDEGYDAEQRMDALRHFKLSNVLRVAAADVSGAMPLMVVSDHLTDIAEVLLNKVLQLAWAELKARFGAPHCVIDARDYRPGMAILAYGKLGGIELGYGSDLDIVFLHDSGGERQQTDGPREIDNASFFGKLGQRVIHMLSAHTRAGVLYETDTRLRPSGRSGLLVSSFKAFAEYQRRQAWTWEHQALVRARCVAGPDTLCERIEALRREILCQPREPEPLRQKVREMREKMRRELGSGKTGGFHLKQDRGGIADIEFIVQYLVLAHAHEHPALVVYSDNIRQLDALQHSAILSGEDATRLRDAYRALRRQVHHLKLQEQPDLVSEDALEEHRQAVVSLWENYLEK